MTDLSRLPEIYALRVSAWEQSPGAPYVNRELFPRGWSDALDTHPTARHWVVEDKGRIVAAARVVVLDSVEECGQLDVARFPLPAGRPYGYLSRLVIAPAYRHTGLAEAFDAVRTAFLLEAGVAFAVAATPLLARLHSLRALTWADIGSVQWLIEKSIPAHPSHVLCLWQPTILNNTDNEHFTPPRLLTNVSRLPEIYALRVAAWEQSPGAAYVNRELFPQGWSDALDTHPTVRHWIVEDGGRIIAAARVVLLDTIEESGQPDFARFDLPAARPWGYLSRLVILPAHRKRGLPEAFDQARMAFLQEAGAAFALVSPIPKRLAPLLAQGWTYLGEIACSVGEPHPVIPEPLCLWQPESHSQAPTTTYK